MSQKTCPCCGQFLPNAFAGVAEACGLSPQQTELFLAVASGGGNVVRLATIVDRLWGHDPSGGPDDTVNGVSVRVHNANKRLASSGYRIENVWGQGYRLATIVPQAAA